MVVQFRCTLNSIFIQYFLTVKATEGEDPVTLLDNLDDFTREIITSLESGDSANELLAEG